MKKFLFLLFITLLLFTLIACTSEDQVHIDLTSLEQEWLDEHPVIYYAPDPEFAPYEYFENAIYQGIFSDYISLIEEKLGVEILVIDSISWSDSLELGRNNEIDFMTMTKTSEREQYFDFTESFLNAPNVLLVNDSSTNNFNIKAIDNYNIGVLNEYSSTEFFKLVHPSAKTTFFDNTTSGILELSYGSIDALLVDLGQASYYINKLNINHLSINDDIDFEYQFSFAVPKDNSQLLPILNKVVLSMSEMEHINIRDKWIQSQYKEWFKKDRLKLVYTLLFTLLIISIAISMWTITLKRVVNQKTNELESLNQDLEKRVSQRTEELTNLNYELEASLEKIIETQEELVQSKKYEALGKLVSGVAHEINTPLGNAITSISYSHRIIKDLDLNFTSNNLNAKKLKDFIFELYSSNTISNDNLNKAALIISKFKLLEISRLTKNIERINLKAVINMTIDNMTYQNLIRENVLLELDIEDNITLRSPVSWIQEISTNLILNAIQHNPASDIIIKISAKKSKKGAIEIIFEDNGVGIEEIDRKRIFDPFYTKKNSNSNIGLGLSIAHNIVVSNLYGSITLDSEYGEFTRFTILLPKQI